MADREPKDEGLFKRAMHDVIRLKTPPRSDSKASRKSTHRPAHEAAPDQPRVAALAATPAGAHDDDGSHRKHGVQLRVLQKLKRGRFPPADQVDLHDLTVIRGLAVLHEFLEQSRSAGLRCVRVIHGKGLRSKGGPRLKLAVHHALRDHHGVLAFTACKPADGGGGAVDVLLRSQ